MRQKNLMIVSPDPEEQGNGVVLLVEDDQLNQLTIKTVFRKKIYNYIN